MTTLIPPLAALVLLLSAGMALAHDYKAGDVAVLHPWTRATPPNAVTAGAYLKLRNDGSMEDALVGVRSAIAEKAEIHSMTMDGAVMRMRPVGETGVVVKPGETVALAPGGVHIMMVGLKHPLAKGERVPMTLTFRSGASVTVELMTQALGGGGTDHGDAGARTMEHSH
jgi:copper(I)-binding protein